MFGYLRLAKRGMDRKDRTLYNAHFCAACHGMAEFGGRLASFLTNYDQTFLMVVFSALDCAGEQDVEMRACTAMPLRRVGVQPVSEEARPLLAALNVALIDAKLEDDVVDEGRLRSRLARRLLGSRSERARQVLADRGFPLEVIARLGERQAEVEGAPSPCLTSLSTPTAQMLGEVFAFVAPMTGRSEHQAALREVGESLGRFLYVWDAVEDVEGDARNHRFNALTAVYGRDWDRMRVRGFLLGWLSRLEKSLNRLPLERRTPLAGQLLKHLRSQVDARLPGEVIAMERIFSSALSQGPRWLEGLRSRLQPQRGDCDCNGCDGCCDCCDLSSCACDCCGGASPQCGAIIVGIVVIIVIILIILYFVGRHEQQKPSTPVPSYSPSTAVTRSIIASPSAAAPSMLPSASSSTRSK